LSNIRYERVKPTLTALDNSLRLQVNTWLIIGKYIANGTKKVKIILLLMEQQGLKFEN